MNLCQTLKEKGTKRNIFQILSKGLENFNKNINLYSVVLNDFKMEDMYGIEFARAVRRLKGDKIVIIMITAYSIQEIGNREVTILINRVIMNPFLLKSLDAILFFVSLSSILDKDREL